MISVKMVPVMQEMIVEMVNSAIVMMSIVAAEVPTEVLMRAVAPVAVAVNPV
jgi:hypothetical protein